MTEDLSTRTSGEHLSLTDLLAVRMAYERSSVRMYERFIEKCRGSKDPVVRALDLSRLEPFCETLTEHVHLLTQALDVLGDKADLQRQEQGNGAFLIMMQAAQQQVSDADIPVLPSMQALLAVEQFNEVSWGLLLALMKDAELQRFVVRFEQACLQHHEQRATLQQAYEDVVLGLVRRQQLTMKAARPLKSSLTGRAGLLFGETRHFGRV